MHELSVATAILRAARTELDTRGGGRLATVTVAVGELDAVEPRLLELAWRGLVADGPDGGARLCVHFVPARQTCPACGDVAERQPGSWLRVCPQCARALLVTGGNALEITELTFTEVPRPCEVLP
jgi:Zn finger protein HypA/HybF involved in hydrogenase expression